MMPLYPAQFAGLGSTAIMIGGGVFVLILGAIVGYFFLIAKDNSEPWQEFEEATHKIVESEDADAIAFIPYSDGPLIPKPAIYDRELLGGKGGYRTPDGERIYVDGQGNGKFSLGGVDTILAIDPTEHAAAADPLKAWIQHENETGSWIKVDRKGNVIEAAEALTEVSGMTPAMEKPLGSGAGEAATDGGYASEVHKKAAEEGMGLEDAKAVLEQEGLLKKVVDIAPPSEAVIDPETGEVDIESASLVGVDISAAADMLPKKTNTTDWQTMEEKARQEGRDEDKLMEYFVYGAATGGLIGGGIGVVMALIFAFT